MNIYTLHTHSSQPVPQDVVACIGYFDGLHLGHQALVQKVVEQAKEKKAMPALISFEPDPWVVLKQLVHPHHLMTVEEREVIAEKMGIECFIFLDFTEEMAGLSPQEFIEKVLGQLHLKALVCGFDFRFGQFGKGDSAYLKDNCSYPVYTVGQVGDELGKISSTRISRCLEEGKIEEVNALLGRDYSIEGTVIHGLKNGHQLGYPTANLDYSEELLLPKAGIYGGYVILEDKKYLAMISLGHNPSVQYLKKLSLEVHILDYQGDLYGQSLRVYFLAYLREEIHFSSIEKLKEQLAKDEQEVRKRWE